MLQSIFLNFFTELFVSTKKLTRTKIQFFIWKLVRLPAGQRELKNLGGRTYPFLYWYRRSGKVGGTGSGISFREFRSASLTKLVSGQSVAQAGATQVSRGLD